MVWSACSSRITASTPPSSRTRGGTTDKIAQRDPCAAIRPEDDELLRTLASAAPSKLLLTSRLIPRVLLNTASQPLPGVLHERLPGLRPPDAEALLRACGIRGSSEDIQNYLKSHCDCHPLVTGVLAGLINNYLPERGNFDAWVADHAGGAALNFADLDLVQKRNHILRAALNALSEKSRQLLSLLALLSEAADYPTLSALNPHVPSAPEEVREPQDPEKGWRWKNMSDEEKAEAQRRYQADLHLRRAYEEALTEWRNSLAFREAPQKLTRTVRDLERRGLLQYDSQTRRYDLHPVVRGIAAGGLQREEVNRYGQQVVDHFSQVAHSPYEEAETLNDVRDGLHVVRTLLRMGRYQDAMNAYRGGLQVALMQNLEAYQTMLSLLRPFFPNGWATLPNNVRESDATALATDAGGSLRSTGEPIQALEPHRAALQTNMRNQKWYNVTVNVRNICNALIDVNRLAAAGRCQVLALNLALHIDDKEALVGARLDHFGQLGRIGRWVDAEEAWTLLESAPRDLKPASYWGGSIESAYAYHCFRRGEMTEEHLVEAEKSTAAGRNHQNLRGLRSLRGQWHFDRGEWNLAARSLSEAVRMAREVGQRDSSSETLLVLANLHLGHLRDPRQEAEELCNAKDPSHLDLARLWLAIGDVEQAKKHSLTAYREAWADGEPYVYRYTLNKARALLEQLGAEIPDLPPYDPAKDPKFPWEDELAAAIEKLEREEDDGC
jgi:tetratricopeptide (TPR) repeat protein